jgi:hypothetical protein
MALALHKVTPRERLTSEKAAENSIRTDCPFRADHFSHAVSAAMLLNHAVATIPNVVRTHVAIVLTDLLVYSNLTLSPKLSTLITRDSQAPQHRSGSAPLIILSSLRLNSSPHGNEHPATNQAVTF